MKKEPIDYEKWLALGREAGFTDAQLKFLEEWYVTQEDLDNIL